MGGRGRLSRARVGIAAVATALALVAAAQPVQAVQEPRLVRGIDTTGLQESLDAMTAAGAVGAVAEVSSARHTWRSASGIRRIGGAAARPRDRFRAASITKTMVATLVLQQVQRGRWTLDTRVDRVLPHVLPGHGDVTIRQLLSHRSGLPDYLVPLVEDAKTAPALLDVIGRHRTDRELVRAALTLPWLSESGTGFSYSNSNYVVLGMMLRKATGRSIARLLDRRVFRPARMHHSSFARSPGIRGPHLTEYATFAQPLALTRFDPTLFSSAGAVVSTVDDVDRFFDALLGGRLLSRRLVRTMATPLTPEPLPYGLGIYSVTDPCPAPDGSTQTLLGHDGASFGTLSISLSSPDTRRQVTVAFTGRNFLDASAVPIDRFLEAGLLATCATPPAAERGQTLRGPRLDRRVLDRLTAAP